MKRLACNIRRLSVFCCSLSIALAFCGCGFSGAIDPPSETPQFVTAVMATPHPLVARFTIQVSTPSAGDGSVLWRLGREGDIALLNGEQDDWFYGQHFPTFAERENSKTRLAVFDNRATNQAGTTCATETDHCYSRAVIFEVDEVAKTAFIIWENKLTLYSLWGGNIQAIGDRVEYTLSNPFPGLGSRISEVDRATNQLVWQMDITGQLAYRGYRIPSLYPGVQW